MNTTTITAISTAPGIGGIAIIRVSGPDTIEHCNAVFDLKKIDSIAPTRSQYRCLRKYCWLPKWDCWWSVADSFSYTSLVHGRRCSWNIMPRIGLYSATHSSIINWTGLYLGQAGWIYPTRFSERKMDLSQAEAVADWLPLLRQHRIAWRWTRCGEVFPMSW